jgi:ribonuclease-3
MSAELESLELVLGYSFANREYLRRALTHKSHRFERPAGVNDVLADNEQLEFLGDSILGFVVSEVLVRNFPQLPEGGLSKRKAHLVSANRLYEVAQSLCLGRFLLLGRGEELSGGREKRALLANAIEALIAAIYLDGGMDQARCFILRHVFNGIEPREDGPDVQVDDFKSALQELTQVMKLPTPRYSIVREQGPEHSKIFTVEVRVGKDVAARAEGFSKKAAGQKAAEQALGQLRYPERPAV